MRVFVYVLLLGGQMLDPYIVQPEEKKIIAKLVLFFPRVCMLATAQCLGTRDAVDAKLAVVLHARAPLPLDTRHSPLFASVGLCATTEKIAQRRQSAVTVPMGRNASSTSR